MFRPASIIVVMALAAGLGLSATGDEAHAAWPNQPTVNLPVSVGPGNQSRPALVHDGAGGVFIAWDDQVDAFVLRLTRSGAVAPGWPAGGISLGSPAPGLFKYIPALVSDGNGGAIVVWNESTGPNTGVYAQHVTAAGVDGTWPSNGVLLSVMVGDRLVSDVAADGQGGALVTWRDQAATYDVYAQRVAANGAVAPGWPAAGVLLTNAALDQWESAIASDGAGGALVAWQDARSGLGYDIYATHVLASGAVDAGWPVGGRLVCNATLDQTAPRVAADGAGGVVVAWQDGRAGAGNDDFYAHHVQGNGVLDVNWNANGNVVVNAAGLQWSGSAISDGVGGMYLTWADGRSATYDVYVHHVLAGGIDGAWPANGRAVCTAAGSQGEPVLALDGAGGVIVAWHDNRIGTHFDIYAGHVSAAGVVDTAYPVNGRAVCLATNHQLTSVIAGDDNGGAILTWNDSRAGNPDLYAQRIGRHGYLGTPEGEIVSVRDVVLDQGGQVKVSWNASWLDAANDPNLAGYDLYRSVPTSLARRRLASGARVASFGAGPPAAGQLVALPGSPALSTTDYWEYIGTATAVHFPSGYSLLAPTEQDSVAEGNPRTRFTIVARNASYSMYWPSAPDSGYSVDDLAPAAPAPLTGVYGGGATALHWNPNLEADLFGYRVYRGSDASFVPGPGNLIASPADTGYVDAGGGVFHYKVTAVDIHGNESPVAWLSPSGTVDVGDVLPSELWFAAPSPNPSSSSVAFRFALPHAERARLGLYDAAGRLVRVLADGVREAGVSTVRWDLRDAHGKAVPAGLYFARLDVTGTVVGTQRVAVAR